MLGTCGIGNGIGGLQDRAIPEELDSAPQLGQKKESAGWQSSVAQGLMVMLWDMPLRRPLAAANLVVSFLLILASSFLVLRKSTALWWITQALLANMVWTLGEAVAQCHQLWVQRARLARFVATTLPKGQSTMPSTQQMVLTYMAVLLALGLVRVSVYAWLLRRARSPEVSALLQS